MAATLTLSVKRRKVSAESPDAKHGAHVGQCHCFFPPLSKWLSHTVLKPTPNATKVDTKHALPAASSDDACFSLPMLPPLKRSRESFDSGSRLSAPETLSVKRRKVTAKSPDAKDSVDVGPLSQREYAATICTKVASGQQT